MTNSATAAAAVENTTPATVDAPATEAPARKAPVKRTGDPATSILTLKHADGRVIRLSAIRSATGAARTYVTRYEKGKDGKTVTIKGGSANHESMKLASDHNKVVADKLSKQGFAMGAKVGGFQSKPDAFSLDELLAGSSSPAPAAGKGKK